MRVGALRSYSGSYDIDDEYASFSSSNELVATTGTSFSDVAVVGEVSKYFAKPFAFKFKESSFEDELDGQEIATSFWSQMHDNWHVNLKIDEIIKELEWLDFYNSLFKIEDPNLTKFVLDTIPKVRTQLARAIKRTLPLPKVSPSEDEGVILSWDFANYYLSVDILTDNSIEWFIKDKISGNFDGEIDHNINDFPPAKLLTYIQKIIF